MQSQSFFGKVFLGIGRALRGLVAEKKGNVWEASKGNIAFWLVLGHCLYVWNRGIESVVDGTTKAVFSDVSQGEMYTLWLLLGYAGVKLGASTLKALKSNGIEKTE